MEGEEEEEVEEEDEMEEEEEVDDDDDDDEEEEELGEGKMSLQASPSFFKESNCRDETSKEKKKKNKGIRREPKEKA
jgi:hypothetical protein